VSDNKGPTCMGGAFLILNKMGNTPGEIIKEAFLQFLNKKDMSSVMNACIQKCTSCIEQCKACIEMCKDMGGMQDCIDSCNACIKKCEDCIKVCKTYL